LEKNIECLEIRPFGPPILKFTLPQTIVEEFNAFIDTNPDERLIKELDHSEQLAGKVSSELVIPRSLFANNNNWGFFERAVSAFVSIHTVRQKSVHATNSGADIAQYYDPSREQLVPTLHSAWYVRSWAGDYNPIHMHPSCHLTSVGFISLPDWESEMAADAADHFGHTSGCLQLMSGHTDFFVQNTYTIKPKVGDFYLFPAWVPHCVYPFLSPGERRSFSINFGLKRTPNVTNAPIGD